MKTRLFPVIVALALAGCAAPTPSTNKPQPQQQSAVGDISNPEAEKPPFIGMTKAQALARYGEPKKRTMTDEGENWVYILNFGEVMGRAMIPFNFKSTAIRTGVLIFGPDGRVKKFNWDTPTDGIRSASVFLGFPSASACLFQAQRERSRTGKLTGSDGDRIRNRSKIQFCRIRLAARHAQWSCKLSASPIKRLTVDTLCSRPTCPILRADSLVEGCQPGCGQVVFARTS